MSELKDLNLKPITSETDIDLMLFPSRNGLSDTHGFDVYYGELSLVDLDKNFDVEKNSDVLDEALKMQRDVDTARVKGLTTYLTGRADYALPPIIFFVNQLSDIVRHEFKAGVMVEATLKRASHRFIVDGQGRTYTVKQLLEKLENLREHGIGFMMVVTNTDSIYDAEVQIRQLFSDFNGKTKKPSTSLSLYFDSSKPFSRLLNEVIEAEIQVGDDVVTLSSILSKQGGTAKGKLWTYKQFSQFFCTLFNESEGNLNKSLEDQSTYDEFVQIGKKFAVTLLNSLPLEKLSSDNWRSFHSSALFTKALFAKGLALVGLSLIEEATHTGEMNWSKLSNLSQLPLDCLGDELWVNNKVTSNEDGNIKIIRGCESKIARVLCNKLFIMPSMEV